MLVISFCLGSSLHSAVAQKKSNSQSAEESVIDYSSSVTFVPPAGWRVADPESLPKNVKIMVVGKGRHEYPPSMNLSTENFKGTLKDYLKIVKNINEAQKSEWKDLGFLKTEAGEASLSQVDSKTEWGHTRLMHVITVKDGTVYILTAAALKDEFGQFYKDFFKSMKSLKINKTMYDIVKDAKKRESLKLMTAELQKNFNETLQSTNAFASKKQYFLSESFQQNSWLAYQNKIDHSFPELNDDLKRFFYEQVEKTLTEEVD